ncbi:hypothetical protein VTL71DRAFT_14144 [Oculimacula yallundae]|uniref:Uncharacterized protein n=1 Tax=Oculimacula yallundae TaxID=86028 RepID=A0ABR4CHM9_9HELO
MDPLSVLASVIGILAATTKVATALSGIKSSLVDAPRTIDHALSQVNSIKAALSAIEKLLLRYDSVDSKRIAMIQVDDLVVTLTDAVLTFDEFETLVSPFLGLSSIAIGDRMKWAWKNDEVESILGRLERHKSTMLLMLSIAQSASDIEAEKSQVTLRDLVAQVLESNMDISRRLRSLEDASDSRSVLTDCFRNRNLVGSGNEIADNGRSSIHNSINASSIGKQSRLSRRQSAVRFSGPAFQHSFEADLNSTRVYTRTRLYNSDESFTTSGIRSHAWSVFSGMSLSEISNISAIALPLYLYELKNSHWYISEEYGQRTAKETQMMSDMPVSSTSDNLALQLVGPVEASGRGLIATSNVANRDNAGVQPIFQACIQLRQRLSEMTECNAHLIDTANGKDDDNESDIDPVTILWRCLRETTLLITVFNSLYPEHPLEFDARLPPAIKPKMAAYKFVEACLKVLKMSPEECFRMRDLFGDDTTGFVKVTRLIERVLDEAKTRVIPTSLGIDTAGSIIGPIEPQPQYRDYVVRELVETERKYIQNLEQLHNLKELIAQRGVIPGNVIHDIFLNLDDILDFGRRFLIKLEMINLQPSNEQKWGLSFAKYEEAFNVYLPYIANQRNATATALHEFHSIAQIDHALTVDSNTLGVFLVGPLPRLLKYPSLLKDLRDETGADENTKADLTSGIEAIERVIQKAKDAIDRDLRTETRASLCARVEDWKHHRVDHFGDLLIFGQFPILQEKLSKEYEVFLFEHILLACTEVNPFKLRTGLSFFQKDKPRDKDLTNRISKLRLTGRVFMTNITDVIPLTKGGNYTVQVFWKGDPGIENLIIRFPNESVMKRWHCTIDEQSKNRALLLDSSRGIDHPLPPQTTALLNNKFVKIMPPISEDEIDVLDPEYFQNTWYSVPLSAYSTPDSTTSSDNAGSSSPPANPTYYEDKAPVSSQLRFKLTYEDTYIILVTLSNITYQALIDRIDAKLSRFCEDSVAEGTLRLKYRDDDGDMCSIESDEDLQIAFQEQCEMHERQNLAWPKCVIELFCVKV